jgi:hypothetical protein
LVESSDTQAGSPEADDRPGATGVRNGPGRHPDGELLGAYADGERTPGSVDRHVRSCADCQRAVHALRGVRVELARLASVTMPPEVANRIQAALAAAPTPPAAPPSTRFDRGPGRGRGGDRRPPSYSAHTLRPATNAALLPRPSRSERLALLAVCLLVAATGAGLFAAWQSHGGVRAGSASSAAVNAAAAPGPSAVWVADSGTALTQSGVVAHARDLLAGRVPGAASVPRTALTSAGPGLGAAVAGGPAPSWAAVVTRGLVGCYQKLAAGGGVVLAVDRVSFAGRQAVLVVVDIPGISPGSPGTAGAPATPRVPDRLQLAVVDLGCEPADLAADTRYATTATGA